MKKTILLLSLLILAISAPAYGRGNIFRNHNNEAKKTAQKTTSAANRHKADSIFESVSRLYSRGKISADSVVSLALYHKVWSPAVAERCLKLVGEGKNPRATMELGVLYAFAPTYANRAPEGLKLLQAAAKAGYNEANGYLGLYYFNHNDFGKAKSYFDAWKPIKYGFGYTGLGNMYFNGKGVPRDSVKALENYRQAALKGYPRGMALYGLNLESGRCGITNYPEAFAWVYMAGDLGDDGARTSLMLPRRGDNAADSLAGPSTEKLMQVLEVMQSKRNLKNEPIYKDGFLAGLKACEKDAEQGDDWSRFYLGSMNYNDEFLNGNYAQALRYYEPIARNGKLPRSVLALVNERLARMYREGKGTKADPAKAARYARVAAQYGSLPAYKIVEGIPE